MHIPRMFARACWAAIAAMMLAGPALADQTWIGTTDTDFEKPANWGGTAPANDTTTDLAVFSGAVTGNQPELTEDRSVRGLNFLSGGWDIFSAGAGFTLSLGSYGIRNDPSGTNIVDTAAVLSISDAETMIQTDNGYLDVRAKITGAGGLRFYGLRGDGNQRDMYLRGDNDFTGNTLLTRSAWVHLFHANALGTAASTVTVDGDAGYRREARLHIHDEAGGLNANKTINIEADGYVYLAHGVSLSNTINLNGGVLLTEHDGSTSNARNHSGNIVLGDGFTSTISGNNGRGTWVHTGTISGSGDLNVTGGDGNRTNLYFRGNNTYTGDTTLTMSGWGAGNRIYAGTNTAFGTGDRVTLYHANSYTDQKWGSFVLEDDLTMDYEFFGTGVITTGSYVLTVTGELTPDDNGYGTVYGTSYSLGSIEIEDLAVGTAGDGMAYNWDFGVFNTAASGDPPVYEWLNDLILTETLNFGAATHTLNVTSWTDEQGGNDPAGDYVLFTYSSGTDPDENAMDWTIAGLGEYVGNIWVDEDANRVMLTISEPVPEPATLALLGIGGAGLAAAARRRRR